MHFYFKTPDLLLKIKFRFEEAVTIYEDLGFQSLESRLLKYSADEYLFRAALCHLAVDRLVSNRAGCVSTFLVIFRSAPFGPLKE